MKTQHLKIFIIMTTIFFSSLIVSCSPQKKYIDVFSASWDEIIKQADGEKVYFNAWGGSNDINEYIQWAKEEVKEEYNIDLVHVLLQDSLEATRRIQQEKTADKLDGGSVDLFWLNGNSFHILKEQELFLGNIFELLPNNIYIDRNNPVLFEDFTVPTDGLEVPWGTAQLVFFYRQDKVPPFVSINDFKKKLKRYKGSFTYPNPMLDFTGRTFLKNLIYHFAENKSIFYSPYNASNEHNTEIANNGVWDFLDSIHPYLWGKGTIFPNSYAEMITYFKDSEIYYGMTFNPYSPLNQVIKNEFPDTVKSFVIDEGTVANAHFLTIPFNSSAKAAALVVLNFLISPEAQAKKADPRYWGDPSVLDTTILSSDDRLFFQNIATAQHPSGPPQNMGSKTVKEFHSSWEKPIQEFWKDKYLK